MLTGCPVFILRKSLVLHGQYLHSLYCHITWFCSQSKGRAVTHLHKTFKQQLIILKWESLLWGQHCPSPGQSVAARLWLTLQSRGFSAQLSFLQEMNPCKIPVPFCVLFKASLLTVLHGVFSDPLHPTEGFRSQIFRAKGWAKQSQTPKGRVRMCFAREQQCSETTFTLTLRSCSAFSCFSLPFCPRCPGMDTWDLEEGKVKSVLFTSFSACFMWPLHLWQN